VSLDTSLGTKPKTATPAEVQALENRIQEFRNALNRATYKLELLHAQDRGRRPTHVQEALKLKRDIAYLKHKIKELNDELASLRIVPKPLAKVSVGG
jgi:predicted  nucleic acid-binding Zn-ribbon protein